MPNPPRRSWTPRRQDFEQVPEHCQGIDAGRKIKGTKRHVATDVLGLLLVVLVTAASVQDTAGGRVVVEQVAQHHPQVTVAWADSGYKQSVIDIGAAYGIDVQVVTKDPQQRGFVPQRKRWAVERTFGWLMPASPAGSGLRNQPTEVPGDDSLGDDRQHVPTLDG